MNNDILDNNSRIFIASKIFMYHKLNKILDYNAINEIIISLIKAYKLENYIKEVKCEEIENKDASMAYNYFEKCIYVSPNFIKSIYRSSEQMLNLFRIQDKLMATNLDILHSILHEVNHAKQYKHIKEVGNDLKSTLFTKSLSSYSLHLSYEIEDNLGIPRGETKISKELTEFAKVSQNNMNIYKTLPSEIDAEMEATKQVKWVCEKMSSGETYKYIDFYQMTINLMIVSSYKQKLFSIDYPVKNFIKYRNKYVVDDNLNLKDEIINSKNMSFDERVNLGLPITKKELQTINNNIKDKLEELRDYNIRYNINS